MSSQVLQVALPGKCLASRPRAIMPSAGNQLTAMRLYARRAHGPTTDYLSTTTVRALSSYPRKPRSSPGGTRLRSPWTDVGFGWLDRATRLALILSGSSLRVHRQDSQRFGSAPTVSAARPTAQIRLYRWRCP